VKRGGEEKHVGTFLEEERVHEVKSLKEKPLLSVQASLKSHSWRLGAILSRGAFSSKQGGKLVERRIQREEVHQACERAHLEEETHLLEERCTLEHGGHKGK
jgi:hypothetical protein